MKVEPGVNYAGTALIACACEMLAKYHYGSGEGADVFLKLIPDGQMQVIAKTLYNALRNGLMHEYDAKVIRFNGMQVHLGIAWKKTKHLSIIEKDGKKMLVLNVHQMCTDIYNEIDGYRVELENNSTARDLFSKQWEKDRVIDVRSDIELKVWASLIESNGIEEA